MSAIASTSVAVSVQPVATSKVVGMLRLLWKEYRSLRLFWFSIVALAVVLQLITLIFSHDKHETLSMIFNFALGAPAFFAIGAAGAAFAAEKEEGTFDFLRAAPISSGQVLASKLMTIALATVAMQAILWPAAVMFTHPDSLVDKELHGMLGLWLVGALEAIAWGTLFSLLGARPLFAVILAMVAASTCAHVVSWQMRESVNYSWEWSSYYRAAPWRALLALALLGVDIYLGLHWLEGSSKPLQRAAGRMAALLGRGQRHRYQRPPTPLAPGLSPAESELRSVLQPLLFKRSRAAMLGRLLWQLWRQSKQLILTMPGLCFFLGALASVVWSNSTSFQIFHVVPIWSMAIFSTLMGSMVFLSDQEQRRYCFFAEHNVPPRYVWFTRQLLWLFTLLIWTIPVCYFWLATTSNIGTLWAAIKATLQNGGYYNYENRYQGNYLYLPPIDLALTFAAVCYAAGQWASMFVRSGIMAGFLGMLLSAMLCAWTLLMYTMQISFWWSVLPIPIVLLFATWLRAPDWISENKRSSARIKTASVILLPAVALMTAVPLYRGHQVPMVSPGFDVDQYEAQIKTDLNAGLATAKLYEQAAVAYRPMEWDLEGLPGVEHLDEAQQIVVAAHRTEIEAQLKRAKEKGDDEGTLWELANHYAAEIGQAPTPAEQKWLQQNADALNLIVQAAKQPSCIFFDPATATHFDGSFSALRSFVRLLLTSGRQLEADGKLDEALDQYLLTLRVIGDCYSSPPFFLPEREMMPDVRSVFLQIANWAGKKGQTPERLRAAIDRVQSTDASVLRIDDRIKNNYILTRRLINGDSELRQYFYPSDRPAQIQREILWSKLMPWEDDRAQHVLTILTKFALNLLQLVDLNLAAEGQEPAEQGRGLGLVARQASNERQLLADVDLPRGRPELEQERLLWDLKQWLPTTNPDLFSIVRSNLEATTQKINFVAQKRGAMVVLALAAYQLEHGELPKSLADLQGTYFQRWPLDPYSGFEFRYFPHGIPQDGTEEVADTAALEIRQDNGGPSIEPGQPGVWCTSPLLTVGIDLENVDDTTERVNPTKNVRIWRYSYRTDYGNEQQVSLRDVWRYGSWFPIPTAASQ